jgi:hypothetical protein
VVDAKTCPIPPLAITTARVWMTPIRSVVASPNATFTPTQREWSGVRSRSRTNAFERTSTRDVVSALMRARCTSAPVASPPA